MRSLDFYYTIHHHHQSITFSPSHPFVLSISLPSHPLILTSSLLPSPNPQISTINTNLSIQMQQAISNNLFRAPVFRHETNPVDFLLIRTKISQTAMSFVVKIIPKVGKESFCIIGSLCTRFIRGVIFPVIVVIPPALVFTHISSRNVYPT